MAVKEIIRRVYKGRFKDYERNAKYYNYYWIKYQGKTICLKWNGYKDGIITSRESNSLNSYVMIDGVKILLDESKII